ncbi:hypothetical protein [Frigoribacterium sp. CG_9.8]|uniref:hypothetical protein n=1 Tax=Frigoribacterium sp. CG_9.8 TaxID=2787733 RepID=UPI0018C9D983|nr:hypothetical protein [Frigoribacterium sp. CG_9.8]MBG6109040.1 hypothetical protein [Frigoribacterium sp. CG_9.8]
MLHAPVSPTNLAEGFRVASTGAVSGMRQFSDEVLILEPVSPHSWRVCDSRIPEGIAGRMVAFVDERVGQFEVMQIAAKFVWETFETMDFALQHISASQAELDQVRAGGDLSWVS